MTAHFTAPAQAAGKTEYQTEVLRLRVVDATGRPESYGRTGLMLAKLIVENKRDQFAWIRAERSCLLDAEEGATNLLWHDACIPSKSWTRIAGAAPGQMTINWFPDAAMTSGRTSPKGGSQRVLLDVAWEDGKTEWVDLSYEVEVAGSGAN